MFFVYILQSEKDKMWYTGSTNNLNRRLEEHNNGQVESTKYRIPFNIIYYEACINEHDARVREQYLKTAWGKRYIKNRLKTYLTG
jgi:putative endonuclease